MNFRNARIKENKKDKLKKIRKKVKHKEKKRTELTK